MGCSVPPIRGDRASLQHHLSKLHSAIQCLLTSAVLMTSSHSSRPIPGTRMSSLYLCCNFLKKRLGIHVAGPPRGTWPLYVQTCALLTSAEKSLRPPCQMMPCTLDDVITRGCGTIPPTMLINTRPVQWSLWSNTISRNHSSFTGHRTRSTPHCNAPRNSPSSTLLMTEACACQPRKRAGNVGT